MRALPRLRSSLLALALVAPLAATTGASAALERRGPPVDTTRAKGLPHAASALSVDLHMEPLPGSTDGLMVRGRDYSGRLGADRLSLLLGDTPVDLVLSGAAPRATLRAEGLLPGRSHYLRGRDRSGWRRNVPHFSAAAVREAWPGIDVRWRSRGGNLEFTMTVAAGVDPAAARLALRGAGEVAVDSGGDAVARLPGGTLALSAPVAWQVDAGVRRGVDVRWTRLADGSLGFLCADRDPALPLHVDPEVLWRSTAAGGVGTNYVVGVSRVGDGSVCLAGYATDAFVATQGAFQYSRGGGFYDATVARIDAEGTLLYTTYLGGIGHDQAWGVAADSAGAATVYGFTNSADFPLADPLDDTLDVSDCFLARLTPDGSDLAWSTYFGGSASDGNAEFDPDAIALDPSGDVWFAGSTSSPDLPLVDAFQDEIAGQNDLFVARVRGDGGEILFCSLIGGTSVETAMGLALHPEGGVVLAGRTTSLDFPRVGGFAGPGLDGAQFGFVARIEDDGDLAWSTYLGDQLTWVAGVAVDADGGVYVAGTTSSQTFVTKDAFQPGFAGVEDAYLVKIRADGSDRVFSTYLGGSGMDRGWGVTVDAEGCAWVCGTTQGGMPSVDPLPENSDAAASGFVTRFRADGTGLIFSTRVIGTQVNEVAVSPAGVVHLSNFNGGTVGATTYHAAISFDLGTLAVAPVLVLSDVTGQIRDSAKAGKDRVKVAAMLATEEGPFVPGEAPTSEDVVVRVGDPDAPLELIIPGGDAGWRIRNGVMKWKSPRGPGARWAVTIDGARGRFAASASKADLPVAPTGTVLVGLSGTFGSGEDISAWTVRRPGTVVRKR